MLSELIVKIAFWLHGSSAYKRVKGFFFDLLSNPDYPYKKYLDSLMIFLILTSVGILVYEVRNPVPEWMDFYDIYIVSLIFLIEYLLRFWVYSDVHKLIVKEYEQSRFLHKPFSIYVPMKRALQEKLQYITSPSAIIDLLAILPAYRPLRILRIFVLFRVFKLLRYTKSINQFVEVLATKRFELFTLLFLLVFIVLTAGIAIYVFEESENPSITTLFDAFYWALVTISTVGYGDISPVTHEGKAISMIIIVTGIAMISFVTSVIVSAFSEKLDELKENRMVEDINKNEAFIIICGYGQMTKMFLRQEVKMEEDYIILDKDPERVKQAVKDGYKAINEDASRHDVIAKFNIDYANITILCLTNSDVENIYIALNAKSLSKDIRVIARATDERMQKKFYLAGVDHILLPNEVSNMMMLTAIKQPVMYNGIHAILTGQNVAHMDEVHVFAHAKLIGKTLEEIDFKAFKILLIGIQRGIDGEFLFNPDKEMVVEENDILLMMGLKISIAYFKEKYARSYL
ncbi:MAG: NAD-binding protein [Deltaproteobacteria bacterium]|nr:NAD-binding protein [Deltaproteobacteria bacterium]